MVLMNLLSLGMIVYNQVTPYIIVESRSFLSHPSQICHATNLTNISFWLPNSPPFFISPMDLESENKLYANTTFHFHTFTYNLEKHLVSLGAHLQYLIHLSPSRHLFLTPQYKSKILVRVLFNLILLHRIHAPIVEHY